MSLALLAAGAGGLLGSLASGGGGEDQVSGIQALPRDFRHLLDVGRTAAIEDYRRGPLDTYSGQIHAGFTDAQKEGLRAQNLFARNALPDQIGATFGSFGNALNAGNLYNDPSVQAGLDTIASRANRNFSETVLPQLRQQATGTGNQFSSKAEQSERLAARDLQGAISDAQGQFLGGQLASARGLQGQTLGNAANILQTGLLPGSTLFNTGAVRQENKQNLIDRRIAAFNEEQAARDNNINELIQRGTALTGLGGSITPNNTGTNPISGFLGGAALGTSVFNNLQPSFSSPTPTTTAPQQSAYNNPYAWLGPTY